MSINNGDATLSYSFSGHHPSVEPKKELYALCENSE